MSLLEQKAFLSSIHPFESLSATQLDTFAENMDIVYFKRTCSRKARRRSFINLFEK